MKKHRKNGGSNSESYNPRLQKLILEVVENQMRDNTPPETKITYDRLTASGDTPLTAKKKIGSVVVSHIYEILHDGAGFDEAQFVRDLLSLK